MKQLLPLLFCCLPLFCQSQALDSTIVKQVDSLVALSGKQTGENGEMLALQAKDLALAKLGTENATYAACLHNLCRMDIISGKLNESILYGNEALRIREKVLGKTHPDYVKTLHNLGRAYFLIGNLDSAEVILREALKLREIISGKESIDYAKSLSTLADVCSQMSKHQEAINFATESLEIRKKYPGKDSIDYFNGLNVLATNYQRAGKNNQAIPLYLEMIKTQSNEDKNGFCLIALANLSKLYDEADRHEEAEKLNLEALKRIENRKGDDLTLKVYNNLGNNAAYLGRYEEAIAYYHKALNLLETWQKDEKSADYLYELMNIGYVYIAQQKFSEAEQYLTKAKALYDKHYKKDSPERQQVLNILARLMMELKRYEEAETYFHEAIEISKETSIGDMAKSDAMLYLGMMYLETGRITEAEKQLLASLEIQNKMSNKENPRYEFLMSALQSFYFKTVQNDKAVSCAFQADTLRKAMLQRGAGYLAEREMDALMNLHLNNNSAMLRWIWQSDDARMMDAAYNNALFYKGFSLESNLLLQRTFRQTDTAVSELYRQYKELQRNLSIEYSKPVEAQQDVSRMEAQVNDLEKQLTRTVTDFGAAREVATWQQVQATLKPGETAVEFYHFHFWANETIDSTLYIALVLRPGDAHPQLVRLFEERQLAGLLSSPGQEEQAVLGSLYRQGASGDRLYQLLWKPLEPLLKNTSKIYYSPDGLLHRIAFSAIPAGGNKRVGDKYQLTCLGSTRQLVFPGKPSNHSDALSAAVFGGVHYDVDTTKMERLVAFDVPAGGQAFRSGTAGQSWKYLPGSEQEATETARLLKLGHYQATLFTGDGASEAAFKRLGMKQSAPNILHIATHGYFAPERQSKTFDYGVGVKAPVYVTSQNPLMRSGLILAGANYAWQGNPPLAGKEDGILTAYEISQLDLGGTDLAVLSACNSGLGDIAGSEGVYGLQRAFKIAGVKNLVISLWQAPDIATKEMMGLFYTHLLKDKMPIAEAFSATQREMEQKYEDPFYWAGFVLVE